ncbi:hypothetical protein BGX28_002080 [Mortierella sp. GBA30]|nr:hypothetical protein BGX28_002080 [Mortierella sp. GBA30]
MAPPKKEKMPSMKELQDLLAALDAEGGLSIGGDGTESANLDDLYEDSYFYAILHNAVKELSINISSNPSNVDIEDRAAASSSQNERKNEQQTGSSSNSPTVEFKVLQLPEECSWGDDHESLGSRMLVRSGYAAVFSALTGVSTSSASAQSIFVASGSPGIGKSCLAYYLAYKLFEAGHDVVVSDPMFTNAFVDRQYYSCYSPHLEKHTAIFQAITTASVTTTVDKKTKSTWWICDDGFLPIKGTRCQVFVVSSTATVEKDVETIRKKNKLPVPVQFQIPKWSLDEIKAGLLVSLSSMSTISSSTPAMTREQEVILEGLFSKFKGNPKKIFAWVKANWVSDDKSGQKSGKSKGKAKARANKS